MWDIVQSCSIRNSDDTSISDHVPNDIPGKISTYHIKQCCGARIFFKGGADFVDGEGADFSAGPDLLYKDEN